MRRSLSGPLPSVVKPKDGVLCLPNSLLSENVLLDAPVSICTFHPEARKPNAPSVAVAAGSYVFIYRNLRPYYKFSLPMLSVSPQENDVWVGLSSGKLSIPDGKAKLVAARDAGVTLSSVSQDLIATDGEESAMQLVEQQRDMPLMRPSVCTCMEVLKREMEDDDAVSMVRCKRLCQRKRAQRTASPSSLKLAKFHTTSIDPVSISARLSNNAFAACGGHREWACACA